MRIVIEEPFITCVYVLDIILGALHVLSHLIFRITFTSRAEAQRGYVVCSSTHRESIAQPAFELGMSSCKAQALLTTKLSVEDYTDVRIIRGNDN